MARPVTIFTGQWADLPMEEMCKTAKEMGYEGLEIASWGQIDVEKAAEDLGYVQELKDTLARYGLGCWAIGMHLPGQCVGDAEQWAYDPRLDNFAPSALAGKPEEIRAWGVRQMTCAAKAAKNMGAKVVTFFMGSPIWKMWYSFPQTSEEQVEAGYQRIKELWSPILWMCMTSTASSWRWRSIPLRSPMTTGAPKSCWRPLITAPPWASTLTPVI